MLSSGSTIGAGSLQGGNSYSNERTPTGSSSSCMDVDYSNDPASGGFFHADYKKHDDLKQMLDSNKDNLKLEAMKRIISMIAKGRDASDLFPAVVKNVVSKNIEVKKLVYVYLVRYAEEQQDLALLSISTFQRALKDPNQLIRASALRVLSSIRVSMIVPIVMLAIRDSASDMSPYVRKTVAHAIPKLYNLDPEQKEELITIIEKLLSDRTTLVVGSAVMAFEEVCPERVDLIHKNYRKLCNLLVDIDEWGQVIIINMLTRYARTQFTNPNIDEIDDYTGQANKPFYENSSESDDNNDEDENKTVIKKTTYSIDLDHRLLLRQTRPLLQSRNASVVMAVAQLYHHVAPKNEVIIVAKALIRLLRSHKEVQSVVLTCIASMSTQRKPIFEPYMKSFFVRTSDPTHIKLLKLEILTNLATETSIPIILREFQTYITNHDKKFVAATIQAIGRCAASIKEVTDTCLTGLVHLLSNKDEYVVAESVVVIKKLLQTQSAEHKDIISQMAKLLDFISVPAARASILWLIGEYNERVPKIAPDVLRKLAKTFVDEEDIVKLQVLNLSVKLYLINPKQTELLCQYIFNLARYDQNYDIRDRVRFLKQFILPANLNNNNSGDQAQGTTNNQNNIRKTILSIKAKEIFLALKPAPQLESYYSRENFQLGSLSHYLNMRTTGYHDLPDFPETIPDPTLRNVEINQEYQSNEDDSQSNLQMQQFKKNQHNDNKKSNSNKKDKVNSFYSDSDKSSSEYNSTTSSSSSSDDDDVDNNNVGNDSETETNEKNNDDNRVKKLKKFTKVKDESNFFVLVDDNEVVPNATEDSEEDSDSSSDSNSSTSSSESSDWSGGPKSSNSNSETDTNTNENNDTSLSTENSSKKIVKQSDKTDNKNEKNKEKSNLDILLDLDYMPYPTDSIMTPTLGGFLTPIQTASDDIKKFNTNMSATNELELVGPSYIPNETHEMLNKVNGYGLSIDYRYTRQPNLQSSKMVSIELIITNQHNNKEIKNLEIICKSSTSNENLIKFDKIDVINVKEIIKRIIGIDFNDSSQQINFQIKTNLGVNNFILNVPVGELIRSCVINESQFTSERNKLRGMTEHTATLNNIKEEKLNNLKSIVFKIANVACIPNNINNNNLLNFVGQTMNSKSIVLLTININKIENVGSNDTTVTINNNKILIIVNCEKMVIASMLLNEIKQALQN